jgi:hypothetical protein
MSDLVALVCTVVFALWFVYLSSALAVNHGGRWVPKAARQMIRFDVRSESRWQQMFSDVVAGALPVASQLASVGLITGNLGRASGSVILILVAEPVIATAWAAYLIGSASSRGV